MDTDVKEIYVYVLNTGLNGLRAIYSVSPGTLDRYAEPIPIKWVQDMVKYFKAAR